MSKNALPEKPNGWQKSLYRSVIFSNFTSSLSFKFQLYTLILQIFIQKVRVIHCSSFRPNTGAVLTCVVYPFSKLIVAFSNTPSWPMVNRSCSSHW